MNNLSKDEFLSLDIKRKIDYLNTKLDEGYTVVRIRENLGIGEKTLQKLIKQNGYKYDVKTKRYKLTSKLTDDNSMTMNIPTELKSNIIDLAINYNKIQEVLNWFENKNDNDMTSVIEVVTSGITINLPKTENTRTTIRVNKDTWIRFDAFCNDNKEFSKQDLLSQALEDFMKKHINT